MDGTCFYCRQRVGKEHKPDCVLIVKKVRVRMTVEYDVTVPADWDADMVEFHRNDSSWCKDNAIEELRALAESDAGCLCQHTEFEYIGDVGGPMLSEE